ncbi:MAG TPA: hypothetical protein VGP93_08700, partial [Polyangiaceae bacterium]|nr:hypothetical protein [Polyangiaceae bacterium]
ALVVAFQLVAKRRPDLAVYPQTRFFIIAALFALGLTFAVDGALRVMARARPGPAVLLAGAVSVLLLPILVALLPEARIAGSPFGSGADFVRPALGCFGYGVFMSAPTLALIWLLSHEQRPAPRTLLFAAATAGMAANLALHAHCPLTAPGHLLAGHATVGLVWAGALLLSRLAKAK